MNTARLRLLPVFALALATAFHSFGGELADLKLKARTDKDNPIAYDVGETIRFDFWIDGVDELPANAPEPFYVIWTRTADDGITVKGTNTISLSQGFSVETSLAIPGIVRMQGTLYGSDFKKIKDGANKDITFGGGAGAATERMGLSTVEPADFDAFWAEAKARLAAVPFNDENVVLNEVFPNTSNTNTYRYYEARVPCLGPRPVTGWLIVPRNAKPGSLAIRAAFAGYGMITNAPSLPTTAPGTSQIYFSVNAHGYDLTGQDDQYYLDFYNAISKNGRTNGYGLMASDYDNPTDTYFYYMALRVVRAFDYLKSRPEWNGRDVIAAGGSQGGLQTMWAGGLVDGITQIRPEITWGCDIGCPWNGQGPYPSRTWGIPCVSGAFYFDAALHAKRVPRDCRAEIGRLGMGDYTCPPRGVLMSYYNMKCKVSAKLVQGSDHGYVPPNPNQTFTISKVARSDGPYSDTFLKTEYAKAMTISFPGYSGTTELTNFPVLVRLSTSIDGFNYGEFTMADGGDLRFTDAEGHILPHEVETWNESGVSTVWVKVPVLTSTTKIFAYYGCATPVQPSTEQVRDETYVGSEEWNATMQDMLANPYFSLCAMGGDAWETGSGVEYGSLDTGAFARKITVTFQGAPASVTLVNFPVLVRLSTAINGFSYSDFRDPNGGDLRFADEYGNLVPHEIDNWDENGVSTVWVKVPRLARNAAITAYYGRRRPLPAVAASDVWDSGYVGVWHLGETSLPLRESSDRSSSFTSADGTGFRFAAQGIVGGSVDFGAPRSGRRLIAPDHDLLDGFESCTFEAWTFVTNRPTGSDLNSGLLAKRNGYGSHVSYYFHDTGSSTSATVSGNGSSATGITGISGIPTNVWTHQAFTFDKGYTASFKNGASAGTGTSSVEKIASESADLSLGNFNSTDVRNFPGKIDEVRISRVARSAAWIKATHDTVTDSAFATYLAEPGDPLGGVATDAEGYDWTNRVVTVTGATPGESLTLTLSTPDGTALGTISATTDAEGSATFDIATIPSSNYVYSVSQNGETFAQGAFFAGGWNADGEWFLAVPDGQGGSTEVNGTWTTPPAETNETSYVLGEAAKFTLSEDALAEGSGKHVCVEVGVVYTSFMEEAANLQSVDFSHTIAAFTPMTNTPAGGAAKWVAHVDSAWTPLVCDFAPDLFVPYIVRLEGDFTLAAPRVRFSVSADNGDTFATLKDAATGAEWLVPSDTTKLALGEVATDGRGILSGLSGTFSNADVASADGTGYATLEEALAGGGEVTLLTNTIWPTNAPVGTVTMNRGGHSILLPSDGVEVQGNSIIVRAGLCAIAGEGSLYVTFPNLDAIGVATAGRTPAQIAADLQSDGANGIPKWQNYVLGLDVTDATAQPFANIAVGVAENTVEVSLGGVTVNKAAGATVTYTVVAVEDLADFRDGGTESEATEPDDPVPFSTVDSGTKFFRIEIAIDLP